MKPTEYNCLAANSPAKLSTKVNELMSQGWEPWGSASTALDSGRKRFTQAMVKCAGDPVPPVEASIDGVFSLQDDESYERRALFQVVIANNGQHYRFDYADSLVYLHSGGFENVEAGEDELRSGCGGETGEAVRIRYTIKQLNNDSVVINIVRITESGDPDARDLTLPRGMIVSTFFCGTNPG